MSTLSGRVLVIAGSDSGGGAGIQADIKTTLALGAYAMTAITALTAQDTRGVQAVHPVPADFVARQITMALADPGADAIKSGMLGDVATTEAVGDALAGCALPWVMDPVMVAKGGAALLAPDALAALRRLLPRVALLTPNLPEAEALLDRKIGDVAAQALAAQALLALGPRAVLLKGGHMPGDRLTDILADADGVTSFTGTRIHSRHTHGTGCTLASGIAAGLAQGMELRAAIARAHEFLRAAIASAPGFGAGHGPLNHAARVMASRPG